MSSTPATERYPAAAGARGIHSARGCDPERRVRHQAQDVLGLMAFSGLLSVSCAVALLLLTHLGR